MTANSSVSPSLRGNGSFLAILGSQSVSALGDAISLTVTPLLVLSMTGSGALMGLVGALQLLPDLVLGLAAGALADRWDRRRMMMWADAGQAGLTALIPVSFWLGLPTMTVLLLVVVPIHALRVFGAAGFTSVLPALVGRGNLGRANGYLEATLSGCFIVGPALAGILAATIGPAPTLAIDAASFAISATWLSTIRRRLQADRDTHRLEIIADIKEGVHFLWHQPVLRAIVAYWGIIGISTAALLPALTFLVTIDRGLGPEFFGLVGSVWSIGYLIGSLLAGRSGAGRAGVRMLAGGAVVGTALVSFAATAAPAACLASAFAVGAGLGFVLVSYLTLRAGLTPDRLLGRVGSTARTLTLGLQPVGLLAGGALLDATSGGQTLLVMGAACVLASLLLSLSQTVRTAEIA